MDDFLGEMKKHENVTIDTNIGPEESMVASDVLLSDVSGIIFDFAFL